MPKSVCIIGAGPSGLVAAKTLATHHLTLAPTSPPVFTAAVYDAHASTGGLWPSSKSGDRTIHPDMTTNLSRHTMQFSGFAWDDKLPEFPRARMVGDYLEKYTEKYLVGQENVELRLGRRVVRAKKRDEGGWVVESEGEGGREQREYDFLLVASGYFGKKRFPSWVDGPLMSGGSEIPVVHSTEFRDLKGLLGDQQRPGRKILVVGGQMSGVEIASSIACEISSAANSPGPSPIRDPGQYTVHHLSDRHTWVSPLFTTPTPSEKAPVFLPSDLNAYNLAKRLQPMTNLRGGLIPVDAARPAHEALRTALGTTQAEFHPLMVTDDASAPPYVSISQFYLNLLRAGLITLSRGYLDSIENIPTKTGLEVDDIAAIVFATGFDPSPSLSFLPADVLEAIGHAPEYPDLTPALAFHGTHHPAVPSLGFAGFYRGPFWGVAEMQARFLAQLWTPPDVAPRSTSLEKALAEDNSREGVLAMRGNPRTSQFPMGDYAFLMQEFARALDLPISEPLTPANPHPDVPPLDVLTPSRYSSHPATGPDSETATSLSQTRECATECTASTKFLAASIFRGLLGKWDLRREIISALPSHPSGIFDGTATFTLRRKTSDGVSTPAPSDGGFDGEREGWEYVYEEDGTFTASGGFSFTARRKYIYRYDEITDILSVWFVKVDDPLRADYLFHEVEFLPREEGQSAKGVRAKAGHLCVEDYYAAEYEFGFEGVVLRGWKTDFKVRGPKKDYSLHGVYSRPA